MGVQNSTGNGVPGDGQDALMYAITGDPVPAALARRPEFVREQQGANMAVDSLRHGLHRLGTELAQLPPAASAATAAPRDVPLTPSTASRRFWPRPMPVAAGLLSVALAGVGIGLWGRLGDSGKEVTASRSRPGVVACADTIAVGTVTEARRQDDGRWRVRLDVERYLKPDIGPQVLAVAAAAADPAAPGWKVGERTMVVVHDPAVGAVDRFTGADIATEWSWMAQALPDSRLIDTRQCDTAD